MYIKVPHNALLIDILLSKALFSILLVKYYCMNFIT